jgi:hypothetical protein
VPGYFADAAMTGRAGSEDTKSHRRQFDVCGFYCGRLPTRQILGACAFAFKDLPCAADFNIPCLRGINDFPSPCDINDFPCLRDFDNGR